MVFWYFLFFGVFHIDANARKKLLKKISCCKEPLTAGRCRYPEGKTRIARTPWRRPNRLKLKGSCALLSKRSDRDRKHTSLEGPPISGLRFGREMGPRLFPGKCSLVKYYSIWPDERMSDGTSKFFFFFWGGVGRGKYKPSLKLTAFTWIWMVRRLVSFWG